eukprot:TRINITY_DN17955_c0_g1_i1.p1 TRINITY_DN17955_c0_g1~~TRINITY_DN17955_c0_g1_i1.p1  ORF type:complete len:834 (+),score=340.22 TRINITY_DN17955_c0_g1_i1:97-2598(+)
MAGRDFNASLGETAGGAGNTGALGSTTGGGTIGKKRDPVHTESFRSHNVRFLQQQNKDATTQLDALEEERDEALTAVAQWEEKQQLIAEEHGRLTHQMAEKEEKCQVAAAEIHQRNEQIRVLSEQNRSLLDMLEEEEKNVKEKAAAVELAATRQDELQKISDQYDNIKETGNHQLTGAYTEIAKFEEELRNSANETDQLKEAEGNFAAQAKVDIEALEQKLKEAKAKNVQHLQQIQHNEVHEHRMNEALQRLKEALDELTVQKKGIKMQLDMDVEHRDRWTQSKSEVERRREALEKTVDALRQSLRSAEEQNQRMQEENKQGADYFRQLGDSVYKMMDQLRQNQMELKKAEAAGIDKQKKIIAAEKQAQTLQQNLQIEVDAKLAAEAEARNAAQMQALLQKKNKMLEEAYQLALKAQEKVEKRLQELQDKANALQAQNDYLGTRIDGNEEDKGALRYELRQHEEEQRQAASTNAQLIQQHTNVEDKYNELEAERAAVKAELDYIKREDMLDETGRTKPILIESESKLIERLQINEFLFSAQQARNPVPMLVEKVSHILEMLHTAQTQADLYLQDLQRSNTMLTALRQKNMVLYEKVQLCETWKLRALLKIASNAFEIRHLVKGHVPQQHQNLYLDGLQYTYKELLELYKVITNYGKQEMVKEIHLQDNSLSTPSIQPLCSLIDLCPYLARLDLRRNKLSEDAIAQLANFVERIPGVTSLTRDPVTGDLRAKSGPQLRLTVNLEDQHPDDPADVAKGAAPDPLDPLADIDDPSGAAADAFLASAAGSSTESKLAGPTSGTGFGGGGAARTVLAKQRGGLGASQSLLPPIAGASH